MMQKLKQVMPIFLVWLFHISGMIGIALGNQDWFLTKTPMNLLLCFVLLIIVAPIRNSGQWLWVCIFFVVGMLAEWTGVQFGFPFGEYHYGNNLGPKLDGVPYLIGINWAMLVLITGSMASRFFNQIVLQLITGAALMVFLDFFIEPSAPAFDFWYWRNETIPMSNYIGWFAVALLLHWGFQRYVRTVDFQFSCHLFAAQLVFFAFFYVFPIV